MITYTAPEAVQIRVGNRWRNATVEKVRQFRGMCEVTVVYEDRGKPVRALLDAASPDLRKWGEGKPAKSRPGPGNYWSRRRAF